MDLTWLLIVAVILLGVGFCFCLAVANFGLERFFDVFNQYNEEKAYCELSIQDLINEINNREFKGKLRFHKIEQVAGDAYVRGGDMLLSTSTLSSGSIASYAILAHELGHALQDRDGNKLKVKSVLSKLGKVLGLFLFPSLIVGIILFAIGNNLFYWGIGLLSFGVLIFLLALILRLFTI